MENVPIQQEIAWSRDAEAHTAMLREFVALSEEISRRIANADMRYTSSLVPLAPENTVLLASLPNVSDSVGQSYALFKQRVMENALLQNWWSAEMASQQNGWSVDQMVQWVVRAGAHLGPEIILALPANLSGQAPVLMANVTLPEGLITAIRDETMRLTAENSGGTPIRLALSTSDLQSLVGTTGLVAYVGGGFMIVSSDARQIQRSLSFAGQPGLNPFSTTPLFERLVQAYREGVGWLLAADLQRMLERPDAEATALGLNDAQQLIIEQKTGVAGAAYRATLGFSSTRQGMAAWLDEPAPMGALEFVSPNAYGVAAVVTKDPTLIVEDLFGFVRGDATTLGRIEAYQREHGVDIRHDIAEPLGNEFLVAVDGPVLPTPSWKVVIEVNDAPRLQNTISMSVVDINREAATRQEPPVSLTSDTAGGRTFYTISSTSFPAGIHYTFWAGYMIAAPSRALLIEAIQNHDTGNTLVRSEAFRSQLPDDGRDYASGIFYQNVQRLAESLPIDLAGTAGLNALPTVVALYGEPNRIGMSSKGMLGMNIASMAGIGGMIQAAGLK
jgi:hypothetical protein